MIQAVIFDLDGLLVDSEPCWDAVRKGWAEERGIFDWGPDDHRACMGVSTLTWANYMIRRLSLDLPPQAVIDRVVESMREIYRRAVPYKPGAVGHGAPRRQSLSRRVGFRLREEPDRHCRR